MSDIYEYIKNQADMLRNINLEEILRKTESIRDKRDKAKWHTSRGVISVTDSKYMNWNLGVGGGGAIDLAKHLKGYDYKTAVSWLAVNFSCTYNNARIEKKAFSRRKFKPPQRADNKLPQVKNYLYKKRGIPIEQIDILINTGKLYADNRGNAVFLLLGKEKKAIGAELRGTGSQKWRGMAPGSRKNKGCFSVKWQNSRKVVLCESAIDAISYITLQTDCIAVSTSGVNTGPAWLQNAIRKGYKVYCGFDADETGDFFADKMMARYPSIKRVRPTLKDWNEVLLLKLSHI